MSLPDQITALIHERGGTISPAYARVIGMLADDVFAASSHVMRSINEAMFGNTHSLMYKLERHSGNETCGGKLIAYVAANHASGALQLDLMRHAQDEFRHSRIFEALRNEVGKVSSEEELHGDHDDTAENLASFQGDVRNFICSIHVAEIRTFILLQQYIAIVRELKFSFAPKLLGCLEAVHRDEVRHVTYTANYLNSWMAGDHILDDVLVNYLEMYGRDSWREIADMANYLALH